MTTEPADGTAAAAGGPGHGHFRASHADRARVTDVLKAAFGEGRLTQEELDARVGQAGVARTYAELAALTADLPSGPAAEGPPREPARAQARPAAQTGACVIVFAASVLTVLLLVRPMTALAFVAALGAATTIVVASILTAALMLESRHQPRSAGPLPRSQPTALPRSQPTPLPRSQPAAPSPKPATNGGGPSPDGPARDFPQVA